MNSRFTALPSAPAALPVAAAVMVKPTVVVVSNGTLPVACTAVFAIVVSLIGVDRARRGRNGRQIDLRLRGGGGDADGRSTPGPARRGWPAECPGR